MSPSFRSARTRMRLAPISFSTNGQALRGSELRLELLDLQLIEPVDQAIKLLGAAMGRVESGGEVGNVAAGLVLPEPP